MKQQTKKSEKLLQEQATSIAAEISNLIHQYTHDSATSKFFLSEEVSASFYIAAGGFASVIYKPHLEASETKNTHALSFFLILITYGFQIYLKERSLRTKGSPYRLPTDISQIEKASLLVLKKAEESDLLSSPLADEIVQIIIKQLQDTMALKDFSMKNHTLNEEKLNAYMIVALYYGYNMASYLLNTVPEK